MTTWLNRLEADGIGPEIESEVLAVLEAVEGFVLHSFDMSAKDADQLIEACMPLTLALNKLRAAVAKQKGRGK